MVEHAMESLLYPLVHAKLKSECLQDTNNSYIYILVFNSLRSTSSNTSIARSSKSWSGNYMNNDYFLYWIINNFLLVEVFYEREELDQIYQDYFEKTKKIEFKWLVTIYFSLSSGRIICWPVLWSGRFPPIKQVIRSVNSYWSSTNRSAKSEYPLTLKINNSINSNNNISHISNLACSSGDTPEWSIAAGSPPKIQRS